MAKYMTIGFLKKDHDILEGNVENHQIVGY